ncbi:MULTISPECIES: hypothetical protein [unclassified Mesorhizobium]|uniref:hypothetical protein n=1 Tax=unclassified Mesorhizobium TaxID=325217 RepID=UPI00112C2EF2|nr:MULTISPECIES: hypothetical protein [unclassified Mesorhizobium]TPK42327.1 hypothetical protein FJ550_30295 [Mesorhizobium sp. B2-5-2]TPL44478.1 hypothetical protein FJ961_03845 [Mesorhizobium sp. B2-4-5]TPM68665.1 hypothetical protein FJ968_29650 [Mesorhizobium sp. B2-1-6]TPN71775.1 hypothetical protein FJ985_30800 [Mesorhizobium sp. B1-1-2]
MPNTSEKIADNVLLLAIARVSMALAMPTLGLIVFFGSQWLDGRIDAVTRTANQANVAADKANDVAAKVNDRLIAVETKQVQDMAANERFQNGTLTRLDRVQDSIVGLSNAVAALTATLQAVAEERARSKPP